MATLDLRETLHHEMEQYAGRALNGYNYLTIDDTQNLYAIVSIATSRGERFVQMGIVAQAEADWIIILKDPTNKPLVDALVAAGVPREHIVLAYAGETLPDSAPQA